MKIGILTYFWDENPGTLLQAYSLVSAVSIKFPSARVELINYRHLISKYKIVRNYFKYKYAINDYMRLKIYRKFKKDHLKLGKFALVSQDIDQVVKFLNRCGYDLIIVGSDTVWQISDKDDRPAYPNIYWTPPSVKSLKVAYAVSANKTTLDDIRSPQDKASMSRALSEFSFIGVRDMLTKQLVETLTSQLNKEISLVPDPTFLVDIPYIDVEPIFKKAQIDLKGRILGINYPNNAFCRQVIAHFKKKGFSVVSLSENQDANICLPYLDPFTWANIYRLFDIVITDRFHGTIFALKHLKPVVAIDWSAHRFDSQGNSKTSALLAEFGLEKTNHFNIGRINSNIEHFHGSVDYAIENFDAKKIRRILQRKRKEGNEFLDRICNQVWAQ